jgi:hypothetical protein
VHVCVSEAEALQTSLNLYVRFVFCLRSSIQKLFCFGAELKQWHAPMFQHLLYKRSSATVSI